MSVAHRDIDYTSWEGTKNHKQTRLYKVPIMSALDAWLEPRCWSISRVFVHYAAHACLSDVLISKELRESAQV